MEAFTDTLPRVCKGFKDLRKKLENLGLALNIQYMYVL